MTGVAMYYEWDWIMVTLGYKEPLDFDNITPDNIEEIKREVNALALRLDRQIVMENLERRAKDMENEIKRVQEAAARKQTSEEANKQAPERAGGEKKEAAAKVVTQPAKKEKVPVDYEGIRKAISDILDSDDYDYGSYGPLLIRLAWHNAGTYDKNTNTGGSEGAMMRFSPESDWGANAGLDIARAKLEKIKQQFPGVTYADLWSLAGTQAIEDAGGPSIKWRPGRKDFAESHASLPDGLLPDSLGAEHKREPAQHLRNIFYRMGFNDREIVALSGAHVLGGCHGDRSGHVGPWTRSPITFSNDFFVVLLNETWSKKKHHQGQDWKGPTQYEDPSGELMMLPTDMALVWDEKFRSVVEEYANNEELFFNDFANAWTKLQELGVVRFHGRRRYFLFGPRE
eukprot:CAMPEP_0203760604 /NCGR_PEP_ID=MMETSP0098-20131031/13860_1 /ASSEMBLY_ACC=CAM_ASM_000208 /TAXON_ID=96639 /ORGANISM=" , Strain NY0313808BC1" /LENGTH=398 /DNA_ID=CAMNT_0050654241 /DNA_START=210 /DNA_END=1406 /DNA_ORIENTATION=+